jgi:isopentenyl diphosphate isomerase/L-lactate dehydrogenase-like FMN-dependent dehydrogenase
MMGGWRAAQNINDLRLVAKRRLPRGVFDFMDRGTEDEIAITNNLRAFRDIKLKPRVSVDVSSRDTSVTVFGRKQSMPLAIGPTGIADILWHRGELALASAAEKAGVPFTLATSSTTPLEAIYDATKGNMWLQIYMWEKRALSYEVIERAKNLGVKALVLTLDTAVLPNREFNTHNGFTNPFRVTPTITTDLLIHPRWLLGVMGRYMLGGGVPRYANYPAEVGGKITGRPSRMTNAASLSWEDVRKLREFWPGKLILKGILSPEDARLAEECGADGIVVSNHGGRNLDSTMAPIEVLPEIRSVVSDRMTVFVDGGVRRGSDIVKARALGADAVLVGKATLYGLGAGGEAGVSRALQHLQTETDRTLALLGKTSFEQIDASVIAHARQGGATEHGFTERQS